MGGDVIKSFLVGLGFSIDDAGLAKFNKAIQTATLRVAALYGSIKIMSAGIIYGISKVSDSFEQMGYEYKLIAPAINKALILRREMLKAYSAAGVNLTKVILSSVRLNMSLTKTRYAFEAIYKSVASRFFDVLTKQSDAFRKTIYANMPKIQNFLERFIKFIFKALEATTTLGLRLWSILTRVYDFFVMLDKATDGWSTRIVAVIAAWKLLNLSFLATPLGMLLTGFLALLTLWDDFKTFREGGQSLINWGSDTTKIMVALAAGIAAVAAAVYGVILAMRAYAVIQGIVNAVMLLNPIGLMIAGVTALIGLLAVLILKWDAVKAGLGSFFAGPGKSINDFLKSAGTSIMDFAGGANVSTNLGNKGQGPIPQASPIGAGAQNSQTNQNVKQQTNINVMGSADANAIGKAVAGEQNRVNFDLARNLKGATR